MSTDKTYVNKFDGEFYYDRQAVFIPFYIKYIMLVSNAIHVIESGFYIGKTFPVFLLYN